MYPKLIKLDNEKLTKLVAEKGVLITEGRKVSEEIEKLEVEMQEIDKQLKELEGAVDLTEFHNKEKEISDEVQKCIDRMNEVQKEIYAKLKESIPEDFGTKYDALKNKKENLENDRNKIALKAQKYNDKIIPLGRKLMKPYLEDHFDDYDSIRLEGNEVVCTIFNHLEDFKQNFKK